jgi:hypothetical protein
MAFCGTDPSGSIRRCGKGIELFGDAPPPENQIRSTPCFPHRDGSERWGASGVSANHGGAVSGESGTPRGEPFRSRGCGSGAPDPQGLASPDASARTDQWRTQDSPAPDHGPGGRREFPAVSEWSGAQGLRDRRRRSRGSASRVQSRVPRRTRSSDAARVFRRAASLVAGPKRLGSPPPEPTEGDLTIPRRAQVPRSPTAQRGESAPGPRRGQPAIPRARVESTFVTGDTAGSSRTVRDARGPDRRYRDWPGSARWLAGDLDVS